MPSHASDGVQVRSFVYQELHNFETFLELIMVLVLHNSAVVRARSVQGGPLGLGTQNAISFQ